MCTFNPPSVMDSETGLLTAGRDKTARVWNLQSQGDGSGSISASYIYQQHRYLIQNAD